MSSQAREGVRTTLIVGVGNDFRNDDGAGLVAARNLKALHISNTEVIEVRDDLTQLLEILEGREDVYIIDAVRSGSLPGTIHRIEIGISDFSPDRLPQSTHGLSLANLIGLARLYGKIPPVMVFYGIEGDRFGFGQKLTPAVESSVSDVVQQVSEEVHRASEQRQRNS